ncbi:MAG: hypothetical protein PGN16_13700 [Sphingomonas phyllosphaerae]|uniref:hypothetical protein n=1 Tax=Sphingomonas phyllosphaerae TaxID=257003 RepID=UPI002FF6B50D
MLSNLLYAFAMCPHLQHNSETPLQSGVPVSPLSLEDVERILTPAAHWLRCELYRRQLRCDLSAVAAIKGAAQLLLGHDGITRQMVSAGSGLDGDSVEGTTARRIARDIIILTGWAHPMADLRAVVSRVLTAKSAPFERLCNDVLPGVRILPEGIIRSIIRDSRLLIALQFYDACESGIALANPIPFLTMALCCNPLMKRAIVAHGSNLKANEIRALSDEAVATACLCEVLPVTLRHYSADDLTAIIVDELSAFMPGFEEVR